MLDTIIRAGTVVDGTASPGFTADVGISDGRIVAVGRLEEPFRRTIDADGLMITPGFVDPHTHYDAQLFWDPLATPSSWHGVTTVVGGNCGFTLAPLQDRDVDYTRRMMAQVEGMPLAALESGVPWDWQSFGEYLSSLDGRIAVNAGFMAGHCALRRWVLGDDCFRSATASEVGEIATLLAQSLSAGALGLSTTRSTTHIDADGQPVPSRWAEESELLELCRVVGQHPGTSLELISQGCISRFTDEEMDLLASMSRLAGCPLNWNVLSVSASERERVDHQLEASRRAREAGGRVVALTMPVFADNNMSFLTFCALWLIPGWRDVLNTDVPERIARLSDPATRARMMEMASGSPLVRLAEFGRYQIGDVYSPENEQYRDRVVAEIAAEKGVDPFTALVEIVARDDLRTVLWPLPANDDAEDWELRRELWGDSDVLLGGSDAGAHLDRMLGSPYPTKFLADCLRGRQLIGVEEAVRLMADAPARLFGLTGRGRVASGYHADLVVFDPSTVGAGPARITYDLPGQSKRLLADPVGVSAVMVGGTVILEDGSPTGATPGTVLRSGRDTASPGVVG